MKILQVSQLTQQIKSFLESHFTQVLVEGEVSRPTYHTSGHLYFTLKDAKSVINVVMFRSDVQKLSCKIKDGQRVVVEGRVGVYPPQGAYQLYAKGIKLAGEGELRLAFEQLKKRLEKEGYFAKKRPIAAFVHSIAIVTSKESAALQDMLHIINKRWPLVKVFVVDTLVQGKEAAAQIAEAMRVADGLGVDVIVVGRGGGSVEDLWCFNEEVVAEAIFNTKTPVVSAVGHEIDYVISDYVADYRAPTPSAAMQMILPDRDEVLQNLDALQEQLSRQIASIIALKAQELKHLQKALLHLSPHTRIASSLQELSSLQTTLKQAIHMRLTHKEQLLPQIRATLHTALHTLLHQKQKELDNLKEKISLAFENKKTPSTFAQVVKSGKPISLKELEVADEFELQDLHYKIRAKVIKKDAL